MALKLQRYMEKDVDASLPDKITPDGETYRLLAEACIQLNRISVFDVAVFQPFVAHVFSGSPQEKSLSTSTPLPGLHLVHWEHMVSAYCYMMAADVLKANLTEDGLPQESPVLPTLTCSYQDLFHLFYSMCCGYIIRPQAEPLPLHSHTLVHIPSLHSMSLLFKMMGTHHDIPSLERIVSLLLQDPVQYDRVVEKWTLDFIPSDQFKDPFEKLMSDFIASWMEMSLKEGRRVLMTEEEGVQVRNYLKQLSRI
jgi:hypothetical protein